MQHFLKHLIKTLHSTKGYTLTELSISTTIIAILAVGALTIVHQKSKTHKIDTTKERLNTINAALHSFIKTKRYIPCPSDPALKENNANFGKSSPYANNKCAGNLTNGTGAVPVKELNLPDKYSYDGWNRKFTFRTADFSGSQTDFDNSLFKGNIAIVNKKGTHKTDINKPPPNNSGAIYVIISHGSNGKDVAWRKNDTTTPPSQATGVEEVNTNHTNKTYAQATSSSNFDDIVLYSLKQNIIPPKNITSPIQLDILTCENSNTLINKGRSSLDNFAAVSSETNDQANQIFKNAATIAKFCDNNPSSTLHPAIISNLTFWLDADDHNSLYTNNNCTSGPEPAADASIGCWKDKSGNNIHVTEGTNKPTYKTNIQNGKPVLRFDGTNDRLSRASVNGGTLATANEVTVFMAYKYNSPAHHSSVINWENLGNRLNIHGLWSDSTFSWDFGNPCCSANDRTIYTPTGFVDKFNIVIADRKLDDTSTIWVNGAIGISEGGKTDQFITSNNATLYIGSNNSKFINGDIGEIIVYNRGLQTSERAGIEFHLADKWGVNLSASQTNFCPAGMTFQKTTNRPEGSCQCAPGTVLVANLSSKNACHYNARQSFNQCISINTKPTYNNPPTPYNQKLWLDANDCSTLTLAQNGKVSAWADKSANKTTVTQPTSDKQPLYIQNGQNNKATVRFDNTNDAMTTNLAISSGSYTASVVFNYKSTTASTRRAIQGSNNWLIGPYQNQVSYYGGSGWVSKTYVLNQNQFYIATATNNGTTANFYVDNSDKTVTNTHVGYPGTINLSGAGAYPLNILNGDIAEVIIYDRVLTNTEQETINDYLSEKWGIITKPNNVNNLQLWLDAADWNTVSTQSDCLSEGAQNHQLISCWSDKSGHNHHALQAIKTQRPTYKFNAQNHLPTLQFSGLNSYMELNNQLPTSNEITVSAVTATITSGSNPNIIQFRGPIGSATGWFMYFMSGNLYKPAFLNKRDGNWGQDQAQSNTVPSIGQFYIITGKTTGNITLVRVNGTENIDVGSSGNINYGTNPIVRIGSSSTNNTNSLSEIIVYNSSLSTSQYRNIEYYLADKWNITLN